MVMFITGFPTLFVQGFSDFACSVIPRDAGFEQFDCVAGGETAGIPFAALIAECEKVGIKEVIAVIADRGAHASIALHEKHGFVQQGHLANVAKRFGKPIGSYLLSLKVSKV